MAGRVAVATSGGRDSTALLHATARAAHVLGVEVHALHVHHGLVPDAEHWWRQVQTQCKRWRAAGLPITFHGHRLDGSPPRGASVEAWARRERYAALTSMALALGIDLVLLAHHRRDQAETVLLQLLRSAGPSGLSAMPKNASAAGVTWSRPWLEHSREAIEAYVHRHRLGYVDDTSNTIERFRRNALRRRAWPALETVFPDLEVALTHAARRAQEAAGCLTELAIEDAERCVDAQSALDVVAWLSLTPPRRANLLRHWLKGLRTDGAPDSLIDRLLVELPAARSSALWPFGSSMLRLHRQRLAVVEPAPTVAAPVVMACDLRRAGRHPVPEWSGAFVVREAPPGQGVAADRLARAELRQRVGAEQFQRAPQAPPRSLKKQYQQKGTPAGDRRGPLVYIDGKLVYVPGLGIDARECAAKGELARTIEWLGHADE